MNPCAFLHQWKTGKKKGIQLRNSVVGCNLSDKTGGTKKSQWHTRLSSLFSTVMSNKYFEKLRMARLICLSRLAI